jgi:hypothetical protein
MEHGKGRFVVSRWVLNLFIDFTHLWYQMMADDEQLMVRNERGGGGQIQVTVPDIAKVYMYVCVYIYICTRVIYLQGYSPGLCVV